MNYKTQKEINLKFIDIFKDSIRNSNFNPLELSKKFNEYEKYDINDEQTKELIRFMINKPYYKDFKEVNVLVKFRLLQDNLKIINIELTDIDITKRLDALLNK